jgi:hypothetical protein
MKKKIFIQIVLIICFLIIQLSSTNAQTISGASTIQLNSPVTPEIKQELRKQAIDSLSNYLEIWIKEFFYKGFDKENTISMHFLNKFANLCAQNAKETPTIKDRNLTIELTLPDHKIDSILSIYNRSYDSLALHYWHVSQEAQMQNNIVNYFTAGTHALYYSLAHIGTPVIIPETSPKVALKSHVRSTLQKLIDKLDISFKNPIVKGQPPNLIQKDVLMQVTLDSIACPNFPLIATLPDGNKILSIKADHEGNASLSKLKIPFVAHGTFLHIRPNFVGLVDSTLTFDTEALGLKLSGNCDQTLIFNIIKPTFTLNYSASSVNQLEIPPDFANPTLVEQYLIDSCSFQANTSNKNPDITINIQCQASCYTFDEKEQTQLKAEAKIIIAETKPNGSVVEKTAVLNEKNYDMSLKLSSPDSKRKKRKKYSDGGKEIPVGHFFWESFVKLKSVLKESLNEL